MADTNGLPGRAEQAPPLRAYIVNTDALTDLIDGGHVFSRRDTMPGEWHYFPTTKEKFQEALKSIGINGVKHKTYIIDKCDTDIPGLNDKLPRSADIDELNMLAAKLAGLDTDKGELELFSAVMLANRHCDSLIDIINVIENLDVFALQPAFSIREYAAFLKEVQQDISGIAMGKLEELQDNDPDSPVVA